jgi:hypothetical protein
MTSDQLGFFVTLIGQFLQQAFQNGIQTWFTLGTHCQHFQTNQPRCIIRAQQFFQRILTLGCLEKLKVLLH